MTKRGAWSSLGKLRRQGIETQKSREVLLLSKRTAIAIFICSFISESVWADSLELTPLGNASGCINAGQEQEQPW